MTYDDNVAVRLGSDHPGERPDRDRLMSPVTIRSVTTEIVDLPLRRRHAFSRADADHQSFVIVRIESEDGITGLGEGAAPGGPWWGTTTVEAVQAVIDCYLAPLLVGRRRHPARTHP